MSLKGFGTHEGKTECHLEKQDLAVLAEGEFFLDILMEWKQYTEQHEKEKLRWMSIIIFSGL